MVERYNFMVMHQRHSLNFRTYSDERLKLAELYKNYREDYVFIFIRKQSNDQPIARHEPPFPYYFSTDYLTQQTSRRWRCPHDRQTDEYQNQ
uniref:Uncharacterized protein n=1 Tax=Romanomermis culicivorax TaxID=13658 RepID=A0A915IZU7_ROMCU